MNQETKRKDGESVDDFLFRLGSNKDIYQIDWNQIRDLMNETTGNERNESTYRKHFHSYKAGYDDALKQKITESDVVQEIENKTLFMQKEKMKFQDQKREYTNVVRQQARFEHLKDEVNKAVQELAEMKPLHINHRVPNYASTKALVLWSDFHAGSSFRNTLNEYNIDIFRQRFSKLVSEIVYYCNTHNVGELTIAALGDFLGGHIHVANRVQSSEDVIRQIQIVSESMAEAIAELSSHVDVLRFVNIIGNHARLIPNKTESIFRENLEHLIPWYLESRLKHVKNVEIYKDEDGYFVDHTFGEPVVYVHGDLDQIGSIARNIPQMLGIVPKYVMCGHIHHDTVKECGKTKIIANGSMIGVDDYAMSKRLYAEPMHKMFVFNGSRIEYHIEIPLG